MTNTGIPRCLAKVGKNGFIGAIPEIIVYILLLKKNIKIFKKQYKLYS